MVKYFVRLPNGFYNIKLMFAENYFNASGKRIFDVYVQGKLLVDNLDLYNVAGSKSAYNIALMDVEVTDGLLDIHFASEIENPLINGISIEKSSSTNVGYGYEVPSDFFIEQNYPNPFNPTTKISYHLPTTGNIKLMVYNLLGQEVATLVDEQKSPGTHTVDFDGSGMSSGIYFYKFFFNGSSLSRKMILMK